jgi:hypothetical protein
MMERPDSGELNAYVDGELPPDRAARVAQAVAHDRDLAQEVATLLRLKTATIAAFDGEPPPALSRVALRAVPARKAVWLARAALIAIAVVSAATVGFLATKPGPTDPNGIMALLEEWGRERAWSPRSPALSPASEVKDGTFARLLRRLADLQLSIVRSQQVAQGMALDLLGPSGCRLAVWAGPPSVGLASAPALQPLLRAHSAVIWQAGDTQFLFVSHNTPELKFTAMAAALRRATQDSLPTDRTALSIVAEARTQGSPCVA